MGVEIDVYFVYKLETQICGSRFVCFTAHRPKYRNASQVEEDAAEDQLERNRDQRLQEAIRSLVSCGDVLDMEMIGCSYELPIGEELYLSTPHDLEIWMVTQQYGPPWVLLGTADSETAFWESVLADADLAACNPSLPAKKLLVFFLG